MEVLIDLIKKTFNIDNIDFIEEDKLRLISSYLNLDEEITKIGFGTYNNVYKIGDKVIKIGLAKINTKIIDNPYIIKVYLKTNVLIKHHNFKQNVGIEIQDYANIENVANADIIGLKNKLANTNIIWNDVKKSNVGYYKNRLVVIDTDFLTENNL